MTDADISPHWELSKQLPPKRTILTGIIVIFLVWAFFSKRTLQLYASVLFFFYSFTHSMWISVILLGIFQTMLMVPFRIINIAKNKHIKDFETTIIEDKSDEEQSFLIKTNMKSGNRVVLYYLVNFMVSLTTYISIGRLFLTDFYSKRLDPWLLYDFVRYPQYPIRDVWFKIPYIKFENTIDFGLGNVLIAWVIILIVVSLLALLRGYLKKRKIYVSAAAKVLMSGSLFILFTISYYFIRHFPTSFSLAIFSGDISKPFPTLNTITALATFFTLLWLDIPSILKKGELAEQANIDDSIIQKTQSHLFTDSLKNATLVGLGAYFITNQIPCAFELSIFTLEIISWLSPFTLDRMLLKTNAPSASVENPVHEGTAVVTPLQAKLEDKTHE
jgi:hypothetical protein